MIENMLNLYYQKGISLKKAGEIVICFPKKYHRHSMVSRSQCHATGKNIVPKGDIATRLPARQIPKAELEPRSVQTAATARFKY